MATGSVPTAMGAPARQVPRSTGVTLFESRFATSATPLPPLPPGATATASGSTPTVTVVHDLVGGRVDLVQLVVALRDDEEVLAPGCVGQRGGQAADGDLGLYVASGQVTGVTSVPGSVTEAPVVTHATSRIDVCADRFGAGRQRGDDSRRAPEPGASAAARCAQPLAQAAPAGRSATLQPAASPSGQKSPVTASWT